MSRPHAVSLAICLLAVTLFIGPANAMSRSRHSRTHMMHVHHARHVHRQAIRSHGHKVRSASTHARMHTRTHTPRHAETLASRLHPAEIQSQPRAGQAKYDLTHFQETPGTCRSTGRLQDRQYCSSPTMDEIMADEKAAIPILISRLTDETRIDSPIFDHWSYMTVGDVAYFVLDDLFTEANAYVAPRSKSSPGGCDAGPEPCWHRFFSQQSRSSIHDQWLAAWNARKDQIYWDQKALCFKVYQQPGDADKAVRVDYPIPQTRLLRRHRK